MIELKTYCIALSKKWSLLELDFTETNYGIEIVYDQIDTAVKHMCFSFLMLNHSAFQEYKTLSDSFRVNIRIM